MRFHNRRFFALCSISESEEQSYTSSNPDFFLFTAWQFKVEAEVGRVTSSGKGSRTGQNLVDGTVVDARSWLLSVLLGHEPKQRELGVELLRDRLSHVVGLVVPPGTFHVHAKDEATIIGRLSDGRGCSIIADLKVEAELINGNLVLSGIVL